MIYLVGGIAVLFILVMLARAFAAADPRALVRGLRYAVGGFLIVLGIFLAIGGRWGLALGLIAGGISAFTLGRIGPFDLGGSSRTPGSASSVKSAYLDMRLDHDTGAMNGEVRSGAFAGRSLDDLGEEELRQFYNEVAGEPQSLALLEAYLDRRFAGWRENVEGDAASGPRGAPDTGPMTDQQAYEILGLAPGADEAEIRAAHRRLMKRVHPDQGGSTFLAAKINEAKDRLLGRHHR